MTSIHVVQAREVQPGDIVVVPPIPHVDPFPRMARVVTARMETPEDVEIVVHGARWSTSAGNYVQVVR